MNPALKTFTRVSLVALALAGAYVLTVTWRVSVAEQSLFGQSHLVPLSLKKPQFTEYPTPDSYNGGTYSYVRAGKFVRVHKQMINGFQHTYGSALTAFELGEFPADILFRANEYFEAYSCKNGRSSNHYIDTRKDLFNDRVGRLIGMEARNKGLFGRRAEKYIIAKVLQAMDSGIVLPHYRDPRVPLLPTLEEFGCPGLPKPTHLAGVPNRSI